MAQESLQSRGTDAGFLQPVGRSRCGRETLDGIPFALGSVPNGPEGGRLPAARYALKARDPVMAFEHLPNGLPLGLAECF